MYRRAGFVSFWGGRLAKSAQGRYTVGKGKRPGAGRQAPQGKEKLCSDCPIVKFFSRFVNKITITFLLILIELVWLASLYLRLTEYAAWLNGVMTSLSVLIILFLVRKDENPAYTIAWMAPDRHYASVWWS